MTDLRKMLGGAVLALIGSAVGAWAQSATPPEGCTAFLTIQFKECSASIYWRCEAAPEGTTWEASYDEDGPVSVATFNKEFQWLDNFRFFDGSRERLVENGPKPALLSELLETGENRYEFTTLETSDEGERKVTYSGIDRLTGETRTIGGEELLVTEFASAATDADTGETIYTSHGNQFVLAGENLFLTGTDSFTMGNTTDTSDSSPVQIMRPGDKGFGKTRPLFGCGAVDL